jgi:hypothetical protein
MPRVAVGYSSLGALSAALVDHPGVVLRRLPAIGIAEVQPSAPGFARAVRNLPGIRFVDRLRPRRSAIDPALFVAPSFGDLTSGSSRRRTPTRSRLLFCAPPRR